MLYTQCQTQALLAYTPDTCIDLNHTPLQKDITKLFGALFPRKLSPYFLVSAVDYKQFWSCLSYSPYYKLFIGGLTDIQAATLLDCICVVTPEFTLFFHPYHSFTSCFTRTIENIYVPRDNNSQDKTVCCLHCA